MTRTLTRILTAAALSGLLIGAGTAQARVVDKIVAIVNNEIITLSDVTRFERRLKTGGLVDDALLSLENTKKLSTDKTAILQHLVNEKLLDSEVKHQKMEVTIERVEQEIRTIAKNNGISRSQLEGTLAAKGVSMSEYQDFIKTSLERQNLIEKEIKSKIRISDEDVSSYYLANEGHSKGQVFEYTLSHILFTPSNGGNEAALKRARAVLVRLKAGESFETLAGQYSEDPNFSKGGLLGTFKAGEMLKSLEDAVQNVQPGGCTGIIKTADGYHIVKVDKRTLISDPRLEEEKEKIRSTLYAGAFKRQFKLWLDQRRDESFIRINGF